MSDQHEMRRCADGTIRAVYTDEDGREYIVVDGERQYRTSTVEDADDED